MLPSGMAGPGAQVPVARSPTQTSFVSFSGVRPPTTYILPWCTAAPIARVLKGSGVLFQVQVGCVRSQLAIVSDQVESYEPPASAQPPTTYRVLPSITAWCDER